jgi:hypothetical protein
MCTFHDSSGGVGMMDMDGSMLDQSAAAAAGYVDAVGYGAHTGGMLNDNVYTMSNNDAYNCAAPATDSSAPVDGGK